MKLKIGFLMTKLRAEEKFLLDELRKRDVDLIIIDDNIEFFDISKKKYDIDVLFERSVSYSRGLYISKLFEAQNVKVINPSFIAERCGDKYITSQILVNNKIPTPKVFMAFSEESALNACDFLGYPCVLKPVIGSWGRLMAKVKSREEAESIIEHKATLGGYNHSIFYIQEYIEKPGRDIRAFVIGNKTIAAIYRNSEHWITNTARGGKAENCPITKEIDELCKKTADAITDKKGGLLAIDIFETKNGLMVNEVNHTMEFRNSIITTGVNIPKLMVDYVLEQGGKK
ncbi:MAG: lysine biosynthesis protein LysX [Candidatus Woesearchaeota archaeon]